MTDRCVGIGIFWLNTSGDLEACRIESRGLRPDTSPEEAGKSLEQNQAVKSQDIHFDAPVFLPC